VRAAGARRAVAPRARALREGRRMAMAKGSALPNYACSWIAGFVAVGLGVFAGMEKKKFTPVYKDILMAYDSPVVREFHLGTILKDIKDNTLGQVTGAVNSVIPENPVTPIIGNTVNSVLNSPFSGSGTAQGGQTSLGQEDAPNLRLTMQITFWNQNIYDITVNPTKPGVGYLLNRDIEAAEVVVEPIVLERSLDGIEYTEMSTSVTVTTSIDISEYQSTMFTLIGQGALNVDVLFEYELDVIVEPTVFIFKMKIEVTSKQRCKSGINFFGTVMGGDILGETECAESWEELGVERRLAEEFEAGGGVPLVVRKMQSSKFDKAKPVVVQRRRINETQEQVDNGLMAMMGTCFFISVACFLGPVLHVMQSQKAKEQAPVGPEQEEEQQEQQEYDDQFDFQLTDEAGDKRRGSFGSGSQVPAWQQQQQQPPPVTSGYRASATE